MEDYKFRLARKADTEAIIAFLNAHWDSRHPLVNLPEFFKYYYDPGDGSLHFVLAEKPDGSLAAVAGYIPSNIKIKPDIWVSLWIADTAAKGSGLALMAELPQLTGCRVMSCNNIRPETCKMYEFLGYTAGRIGHFYRLGDVDEYTIATIKNRQRLPVSGHVALVPYPDAESLNTSGFIPPEHAKPYKDLWYIHRRYYNFPHQKYRVFGVVPVGEKAPKALLCTRLIHWQGNTVLRIADYIGPHTLLPEAGSAIDSLMCQTGAEYADFYCAGIPASTLQKAGFAERREGDENILPHYLSPPVYENSDFYYFTTDAEGFIMCKADGDQDRPNLPVPPEQ